MPSHGPIELLAKPRAVLAPLMKVVSGEAAVIRNALPRPLADETGFELPCRSCRPERGQPSVWLKPWIIGTGQYGGTIDPGFRRGSGRHR